MLGIGLGGYWSFTRNVDKSDVAINTVPATTAPAVAADNKGDSTKTDKKLRTPPSAQKIADLAKHDPAARSKPSRGEPVGSAKAPHALGKTGDAAVAGPAGTAGATAASDTSNSKDPKSGSGNDGQTPAAPKGPPHNEVAKTGSIPIFVQDSGPKTADGGDSTGSTGDAAMTPDGAASAKPIVWADAAKGEAK